MKGGEGERRGGGEREGKEGVKKGEGGGGRWEGG